MGGENDSERSWEVLSRGCALPFRIAFCESLCPGGVDAVDETGLESGLSGEGGGRSLPTLDIEVD